MYEPTKEDLSYLLKFSLSHSRRLTARLNPHPPVEDLASAANLAIAQACGKFDPLKGVPFTAFCVRTIKWKIGEYIREQYFSRAEKEPLKIPLKAIFQFSGKKKKSEIKEWSEDEPTSTPRVTPNYDKIELAKRISKLSPPKQRVIKNLIAGESISEIARTHGCSTRQIQNVIEELVGKRFVFSKPQPSRRRVPK